jgi:hypothetical protein
MNIVLRKTGLSIQPERAEPISDDDLQKGLKDGTLEQVDHSIYREVSDQTYQTRDMKPTRKVVKKKATRKRKSSDEEE